MSNFQEGVEILMEYHLVTRILETCESEYENPDLIETFERLFCEQEELEERADILLEQSGEEAYRAMSHEAKVRCSALAGELLTLQGTE